MDTAQWPQQGIRLVKGVESSERRSQIQAERRLRTHKTQPLHCPRCDSTNTKFCYYNNYSLSQPRYFCKTCRRYWTEGGSLRNVPVGGGSRKSKRSSPSLASSTSTLASSSSFTNPRSSHELNHAAFKFCPSQGLGEREFGGGFHSMLELLRCGTTARGVGQFVPESGSLLGTGLGFQEIIGPVSNIKDGVGGGGYTNGSMQEEEGGRVIYPFEDLRNVPMRNQSHEAGVEEEGDPTLFWNGIVGNAGSSSSNGGGGGSW